MLRLSIRRIAAINIIAIIGAFASISGGYWDITRHSLKEVDSFFTAAHLILYLGIGLVALSSFAGAMLLKTTSVSQQPSAHRMLSWTRFAAVGAVVQLVAGPFDFWWHSTFGFDPVLLSPPHAMLILGAAVTSSAVMSGAIRLWQISGKLTLFSNKLTASLLMIAGAALWMQLNLVIYLFSIDAFVRESVGEFTNPPALIALALPGILILAAVSRLTGRFGYATLTAVIFLMASILTDFIPRGLFLTIPIVLATLIPLAIFDLISSRSSKSTRIGWKVIAVAPFTMLLYFPWTGAYQIVGPSIWNSETFSGLLNGIFQTTLLFVIPWTLLAYFAANHLTDHLANSLSQPQFNQQTPV